MYWRSLGLFLEVNANPEIVEVIEKNISFAERYIPDLFIKDNDQAATDFSLRIDYSPETAWSRTGRSFKFLFPKNSNISGEDLITIIEYCFEYMRQKRKAIYCVHGSAVSYQDKGFLFLGGQSGLGKTTLALNLCLEKGYKLIGDEKILIGENPAKVLGGIKKVRYNKESLKNSVSVNLNGKGVINLKKEMEIRSDSVKLKYIIFPVLSPGDEEVIKTEWDTDKVNFHLYEELSRKIRGVSRRVDDFKIPLASLDTEEIALKRSNFASNLASNCYCYGLYGGVKKSVALFNKLFS